MEVLDRPLGLLALLFVLASCLCPLPAQALDESPDLREELSIQQNKRAGLAAKQAQIRKACGEAIQSYKEFDLYKSKMHGKEYGIDLSGWIWELVSEPLGGCSLRKIDRLGKADYTLASDGERAWRVFYYEDNRLCRYSRSSEMVKIQKTCFEPMGIVNRFAPYFLN